MSYIRPFRALYPGNEFADRVTARSSDFKNNEELLRELERNPYSFHHMTKSHLELEQGEPLKDAFRASVAYLKLMDKKGIFIRSNHPSFYIYRQINLKNGDQFTGLVALCDALEYLDGRIKKHENVQTNRVGHLYNLLSETDMLGEPVLMAHRDEQELDDLYRELTHAEAPVLRFISVDRKQHELWEISDPKLVSVISETFAAMEALYIADGHHRSHIAAQFYEQNPDDQHRFFLSLIVPESQMKITPFYRLWLQKEPFDAKEFVEKLKETFEVIALETEVYEPAHQHHFGLYLNKTWYELQPRHYVANGSIERLDVVILETLIFKKILGVQDSRSDNRICYFSADQSVRKLKEMVDQGQFRFAVTLYPPNFSDVREVADHNLIMPPKSTFIEPKLRAGMILERYDQSNLI